MTIPQILALAGISLMTNWLAPARWRPVIWALLSLLAVYGLQPSTPIRNLDFWLPTASIAMVFLVWVVATKKPLSWRFGLPVVIAMAFFVLAVGLTHYTGGLCCLTPTRPPGMPLILVALGIIALFALLASRPSQRDLPLIAAILVILGLFIVLKSEALGHNASAFLRQLNGQDPSLADALDLRWLGFSYLAFRLLHVLRDAQSGKPLPASLGEFITYTLFFPTLTAGPIDRVERFLRDLRNDTRQRREDTAEGVYRILLGLFKKFVLADSLALFALNATNASQVSAGAWTWVVLYAYSLRIFGDFSGYTDIALGLGRLLGFHLPENFTSPYLKSNLTAFWNSWHITLAQWFRAYFFNPLTRALRTWQTPLPAWVIILTGQIGTMLLIGLWHGLTWNFAIWGLWHATGLFVNNRWSAWIGPRLSQFPERSNLRRVLSLAGWLLTFNYVSVGWVWFALPDPVLSWLTLGKLLGFAG